MGRSKGKGGVCRPALRLFGYSIVVVIPFWEGHHFDAWEHVVFDGDRLDFAGCVVGVYEENPAAVPVVRAIFFTGFDVQFQSLSCHC